MNYYAARQRKGDGCWDWSRMNDGHIWPVGACQNGECKHITKEEALRHESERREEAIRTAEPVRIDTAFGRQCDVAGCEAKAFHYVAIGGGHHYELCAEHLKAPLVTVYEEYGSY